MLTDLQKYDVTFYLGYPAKMLVPTSTHFNRIYNDRLNGLHPITEVKVAELLGQLAEARQKFTASTSRMLVKKVGDIELNTDEHTYINKEYRRLVKELSALLDLPIRGGGGGSSVCVKV